jgi:hypothetical protein
MMRRGVMLTTHPHLLPRSRMSRSYTSLPPSATMACSGTALLRFGYDESRYALVTFLHVIIKICLLINRSIVHTGSCLSDSVNIQSTNQEVLRRNKLLLAWSSPEVEVSGAAGQFTSLGRPVRTLCNLSLNVHAVRQFSGFCSEYPAFVSFFQLPTFNNKIISTKTRNHITTTFNSHLRTTTREQRPKIIKLFKQLTPNGPRSLLRHFLQPPAFLRAVQSSSCCGLRGSLLKTENASERLNHKQELFNTAA